MTDQTSSRQQGAHKPGLIFRVKRSVLLWRLRLAQSRFGRRHFVATRFLYVPPHLERSDASIAADVISGQIVLAGRSLLTAGKSVFDLAAPSEGFARALHGFQWLADFDASDRQSVREYARLMVHDWITRREAIKSPVMEHPCVTSRRVMSWLTHCGLIAEGADLAQYQRILAQIARDAAQLRVLAGRKDIGPGRLDACLALMFHALCLDGPERGLARAEAGLHQALQACVAEDGGMRDRNPAHGVRVVAALIPILALYRARQTPPPHFISAALLRMISFLRMVQHPDGGLVLLHGGGLVSRELVADVTRFGGSNVQRRESAGPSGFERLENQTGVLIADTGVMPPPGFAASACASALSFEFSTRTDRLIVSCGMPVAAEGEVARIYRSGAASSTLLMDNETPGEIDLRPNVYGLDEMMIHAEDVFVAPHRTRDAHGETLTLEHGGFRDAYGYVVERHLTLRDAEEGLTGLDRIVDVEDRREARRMTLVFHLHPHLMPTRLSRQDAIVLRLPHLPPGRDLWVFEAPGQILHLDESLCYEQETLNPATHQIVIDMMISGTTQVAWRLTPYRPEFVNTP